MKNKIIKLLLILSIGLFVSSCTKEDEMPGGGTAPPPNTLTSDIPTGSAVVLKDKADVKFSANWTATDFGARIVKYSIEIDKAGNNFAHAIDIYTSNELSAKLTGQAIDIALIKYGVKPGETVEMEMRVRSWVDYLTTPGVSNALKFTFTAYLVTFPPVYIIGDAQAWTLADAVQLTSTTPGVYTGKAHFKKDGKFRFFLTPEWTAIQYGWSSFLGGSVSDLLADGKDGDSNFLFGGLTADYNITVSLTDKKITLDLAGPPPPPESLILVTGQTVDLTKAAELKLSTPGLYEGIVMLDKNAKFRFFADKKWTTTKFGWSYFDGGTVDAALKDSGDDLSNFLLTSESGYFKISVSIDKKTIVVTSVPAPKQTLFIIGEVQSWTLGNALQMHSMGGNKFEAIATFHQNGTFRFFATPAWSQPNNELGWNSFTGGTVDTDLKDSGDGDSNFKFDIGSGVYKITVSINDKTITVEPATIPTLYIIGSDQSWTLGSAVSLTWLGGGKYQGTTTFTYNSTFRLFVTPDWAATQWKYSSFANGTIDADFADGGGADSNFKFTGGTGSHTFTVDIYALTVDIN